MSNEMTALSDAGDSFPSLLHKKWLPILVSSENPGLRSLITVKTEVPKNRKQTPNKGKACFLRPAPPPPPALYFAGEFVGLQVTTVKQVCHH